MLVVGHLEAGKLRLFLTEFFHPDRRSAIGSGALYQASRRPNIQTES